jgi:hypothetical protein
MPLLVRRLKVIDIGCSAKRQETILRKQEKGFGGRLKTSDLPAGRQAGLKP